MDKTLSNLYNILIDENIPDVFKDSTFELMEYLANKFVVS